MPKAAIVLLAGTESKEAMGRMANALTAVKEFKDAGDEVKLIFDGAGVLWVRELANPQHHYHDLFEEIRDTIAGICDYCAGAFKVKDEVVAQGLPLNSEHEGHPSFRRLLSDGFHVLTF